MKESFNNRRTNAICVSTTYVIVIVGILAFLYFGQQEIGHLGSRIDAIIPSLKTVPIAVSHEPVR